MDFTNHDDSARLISIPIQPWRQIVDHPIKQSRLELKKQTLPRVRAEAGHVIVRLELVSMRDPLDKFDFEVVLPPEVAGTLGWELLEKVKRVA